MTTPDDVRAMAREDPGVMTPAETPFYPSQPQDDAEHWEDVTRGGAQAFEAGLGEARRRIRAAFHADALICEILELLR